MPVDGTALALMRILAMATITAADTLIAARLRAPKRAAASAVVLAVSTAAFVGNYVQTFMFVEPGRPVAGRPALLFWFENTEHL